MATHDWPVMGFGVSPDNSGFVWPAPISSQLTLTNADGGEECMVMPAAATISADAGFRGHFRVPQNYVGTPKLVITGILNGAPASLVIAFGVKLTIRAVSDPYDVAAGTERLASASSVPEIDKDEYEEVIDLSAETFVAGRKVYYYCFIDDSVHTYTGKFLLTGLDFRYDDA